MQSDDEWRDVRRRQESMYEGELQRWQDVLTSSMRLLDHMKATLGELRSSLDLRKKPHSDVRDTPEAEVNVSEETLQQRNKL